MHNVHLKKFPSRILLLFSRYNNVYKNTYNITTLYKSKPLYHGIVYM